MAEAPEPVPFGATAMPRAVEAFRRAIEPRPILGVEAWADKYRYLSKETAAEPGRWRTSRVPYLSEPLACITDPLVSILTLMFASQTSKTEGVIANSAAYFSHWDPSAILIVQPRDFDAKKFSRVRIAPMIRDTPCLADIFPAPKSREGDNTLLEKQFYGGRMLFAGANAPANLAGDPIRIVMLDEIDRYPMSAGTEGDPIQLAVARQTTFPDALRIETSTPTDESSRIAASYRLSSGGRYFVPCPHCDAGQVLIWKQVRWERDSEGAHLTDTARYHCVECERPWSESERRAVVPRGAWIHERPEITDHRGFHLPSLVALWSSITMPALATEWVNSLHDPTKHQVFVNTRLAEVYTSPTASLSADPLMNRREPFPTGPDGSLLVPSPVAILTAGVDLQDDRIEVQVIGWGEKEESWATEYHVIYGDPSASAIWDELWELMLQPRLFADGRSDFIRATGVDTGHHTQTAYKWCAPRIRYKIANGGRAYTYAIKGTDGPGDVWPRNFVMRGKTVKVPMYTIRVDPVKELLYSRLRIDPDPDATGPQAHSIHLPLIPGGQPFEFGARYMAQLTSEKLVTELVPKTGRERRTWRLKVPGGRNEALDTWVYAYAALCGLRAGGFDLDDYARGHATWDGPPVEEDAVARHQRQKLRDERQKHSAETVKEFNAKDTEAPKPQPRKARRRRRVGRSSYLTRPR